MLEPILKPVAYEQKMNIHKMILTCLKRNGNMLARIMQPAALAKA